MVSGDGYPGDYSYIKIDTTPDSLTGAGAPLRGGSSVGACPARSAITLKLRRSHGRPIVKVKVYVDGHRVLSRRGRGLRQVRIPGLPGKRRHTIRAYEYTRTGLARRVTLHVYGCAHRGSHHRHRRHHRRHRR
jgi:hypothetical protein